MEFWREKNVDTRAYFPIQKNDGTFITGAAGLDSEFILYGAHGAGAPSFADCTHEAAEIGTTGIYYLDVSAAELNDDYGALIQIKSSSTGEIVQVLLFHTRPQGVDVVNWKGSAAPAMTGDAFAAVGDVHATDLPAVAAMLTDIHGTDLPAVKADTAAILTDTGTTLDAALTLALKLLRNKVVTNPATGVMTVYDDNGTTPLYTANVYEDVAGTVPFDGTGANRRDRLA